MASNSRQKSSSSASNSPRSRRTSRGSASNASSAKRGARAGGKSRSGRAPKTQGGSQVESLSIADIDHARRSEARAEARNRAASAARRGLIILGIVVAVVIISLIALFAFSRTDAFRIENLKVEGADHLTDAEVQALVTIPQGTTLLNIDADSIKNSLARDSWVESVDINRIFPDTLEVIVHERPVAAIVEVPVGTQQTMQSWAISKDGMWLMAIPNRESDIGSKISDRIYEDAENAMHITGVDYGIVPEIGVYCTDAKVLNALSIVSGMTTQLADQVKAVNATDTESALITLDNNVEIAFGTADNIREKERICLEIMEQNPTVVYINVRVPDRPTWRAA